MREKIREAMVMLKLRLALAHGCTLRANWYVRRGRAVLAGVVVS